MVYALADRADCCGTSANGAAQPLDHHLARTSQPACGRAGDGATDHRTAAGADAGGVRTLPERLPTRSNGGSQVADTRRPAPGPSAAPVAGARGAGRSRHRAAPVRTVNRGKPRLPSAAPRARHHLHRDTRRRSRPRGSRQRAAVDGDAHDTRRSRCGARGHGGRGKGALHESCTPRTQCERAPPGAAGLRSDGASARRPPNRVEPRERRLPARPLGGRGAATGGGFLVVPRRVLTGERRASADRAAGVRARPSSPRRRARRAGPHPLFPVEQTARGRSPDEGRPRRGRSPVASARGRRSGSGDGALCQSAAAAPSARRAADAGGTDRGHGGAGRGRRPGRVDLRAEGAGLARRN